MNSKKWNFIVTITVAVVLLFVAGLTIIIDPFLHYHDGLEGLEYPLKDERYQNDGIARHYEYDSIITGTSMCQNFACSEFDDLWSAKSVKLTNAGASFHETNQNIRRAMNYNSQVKYVLSSLDGSRLNYDAFKDEYEGYPEYLYDNNFFNDVNYFWNKDVVPKTLAVINYTRAGNTTTTMDDYSSWGKYQVFGKEQVLSSFNLIDEIEEESVLSEEDILRIKENITENFLETAKMYPDTTFYLFFPPYSICYWEALVRTKQLNVQIEAQKIASELLLTVDNIMLFDYNHLLDITGNLENYCDTLHYGPWISSDILEMMWNEEGIITQDNLVNYYDALRDLYQNYDYSLYKKK